MKKTPWILVIFMMIINFTYAQKGLADYSKAELEQKKIEAEKKEDKDDVNLYTKALDLRISIDKAIASEDYESAAKYKSQLVKLSQGPDKEKIKQLEAELQKAVAAENYEKAAQLKKQIEAEKSGNTIQQFSSSSTDIKQPAAAITSGTIPSVEFYNQVYIWDKSKSATFPLETDTPELKTSSYGGFGYAQATSFWVINGTKSDVSINSNMPISFILKTAPGMNPVDLFRLVKFQILGKTSPSRHMAAFTSQAAAFAGSSTNERRENDVPVTFKKLDEGVYEIIITNQLNAGEYTFYGLGKMYSFSVENSFANNPDVEIRVSGLENNNADYYSSANVSTNYTLSSIYSESNVTWYGVDFSLFRFMFPAKVGQEAALYKYIDAWQNLYSKEVTLQNLKRWLKKPGMVEQTSNVKTLYQQNLTNPWIVADYIQANYLNDLILQKHLKTYTTNSTGLGLVMIPAFFNQKSDNIQVKFVWFDNASKAIVHVQNLTVNAKAGASLTSHWGTALVDATKMYVDKYYSANR